MPSPRFLHSSRDMLGWGKFLYGENRSRRHWRQWHLRSAGAGGGPRGDRGEPLGGAVGCASFWPSARARYGVFAPAWARTCALAHRYRLPGQYRRDEAGWRDRYYLGFGGGFVSRGVDAGHFRVRRSVYRPNVRSGEKFFRQGLCRPCVDGLSRQPGSGRPP